MYACNLMLTHPFTHSPTDWPQYTPDTNLELLMGTPTCVVEKDPRAAYCQFWQQVCWARLAHGYVIDSPIA